MVRVFSSLLFVFVLCFFFFVFVGQLSCLCVFVCLFLGVFAELFVCVFLCVSLCLCLLGSLRVCVFMAMFCLFVRELVSLLNCVC